MVMRIGYKLTGSISDRALINVAGSHPDTLSDRSAPRPSSPHIEQAYGLVHCTKYLYELGARRLSLVNRLLNLPGVLCQSVPQFPIRSPGKRLLRPDPFDTP